MVLLVCRSAFYVVRICSGEDHRAVFPGYLSSFPDLFHSCAEGQSSNGGGSVEKVREGKIQGALISPGHKSLPFGWQTFTCRERHRWNQ